MKQRKQGAETQRGTVRAQLLRSATRLGGRDGLTALSVRGVVRQAGTNLNSVHYHFGSREGLIHELATEALEQLNRERFIRFDRLEASGALDAAGESAFGRARLVLRAAYAPLFERTLGAHRARHRDGLSVIQQLRFDPSGVGREALDGGAAAFIARVEGLLAGSLRLSPAQLRRGMVCANATAWDLALRPDTLERAAKSKHSARAVARIVDGFLDFAAAGLCGARGAR